nr:hypothetical protein [Tanacetum cinerariifolium]
MILNTLDNLGKFEEKEDEGYFDGPNWLFDIDSLTKSMNYVPVDAGTNSTNLSESSSSKPQDDCSTDVPKSSGNSNPSATSTNPPADQLETLIVETLIPTVSLPVLTACFTDSPEPSSYGRLISERVANQVETPSLDNILTLANWFKDILGVTTNLDKSNGVEADVSNMETSITASPTPTLKIHKDHPKSKIIGHVDTPIQTKNKSKETFLAYASFMGFTVYQMDVKSAFLYGTIDEEVYVMQPPRFQDPNFPVKVYKVEKAMYGLHQAPRAWYVYQMDVKSAFLYGTIDEEVYVMQPPRFQDPNFPVKVYKVEKAMYGLHQAPRAWYGTLSKYLLTNGFPSGTIDQTLFIRRQRGDFILVQVYVDDIIFGSSNPQLCREFEALMHEKFQMSAMGDILKKFRYSDVRSSNTPMDKENPWGKYGTGKDVDLQDYRSMIGSLMYLTASRPDIMFAVYACAWHQVTPKECHLHAVKRIFRYLKGHPKLELWYPKESPFDLVAYSNSDYGGATQDHKSTTGGC